jgi:hypothetical protein
VRPGFTDLAPYEIPGGYGDTRLVALVRDPNWLFAYWEIPESLKDRVRREHGQRVFEENSLVIRVYDVTGVDFNGANAWSLFDVGVGGDLGNWYVHVPEPARSYCMDLGLVAPDGRFVTLARSNVVTTPRAGLSPITDEEWLTIEEIYGMSVGYTEPLSSAALLEAVTRRLGEHLASPGISSISSPWMAPGQAKGQFWLSVETELIVRGATVPGSEVTVQGRRVDLSPEGTFTLHFALPEGQQAIPVVAKSQETGQLMGVTPRVARSTDSV